MEFTIDINDICYVHIDKKKKFPATALLRAFGYGTDAEIYQIFFGVADAKVGSKDKRGEKEILGSVLAAAIVDPETGEVLVEESTTSDSFLMVPRGGIEPPTRGFSREAVIFCY